MRSSQSKVRGGAKPPLSSVHRPAPITASFLRQSRGSAHMSSPVGAPWRAQLHAFLEKYFTRQNELEFLTRDYFPEVSSEVAWGGSLEDQAHELIEALNAHGRLAELWPALRAKREKLEPQINQIEQVYEGAAAGPVPLDRRGAGAGGEELPQWGDSGRPPSIDTQPPPSALLAQGKANAAAQRSEAIESQAALGEGRRSLNEQPSTTAVRRGSATGYNPAGAGLQARPANPRAQQRGSVTLTQEERDKLTKRHARLKAAADALALVTGELDAALRQLPDQDAGGASALDILETDLGKAVETVKGLVQQLQQASPGEDPYALLNQLLATVVEVMSLAEEEGDYATMSEVAGLAEGAYEPVIRSIEDPRMASLLIRATPYWRMKQKYASYEAKRHEG